MGKGMFLGNPEFETDRLLLRKISKADREAIYAYASDELVTRYVSWPTHRSLEDTDDFLVNWVEKNYENGSGGDWGIVFKPTDEYVGSIGLVNPDGDNRIIEIGYVIAKEYWGKGITTEALLCLIDFVFKNDLFNRIQGIYHVENIGSGRVMEKAGMKYEGILRERIYAGGEYWDMALRAILKKDWMKMTKKEK